MIKYAEYIAENLDKAIDYSEYIAEKLDQSIAYTEYVAEHIDNLYDLYANSGKLGVSGSSGAFGVNGNSGSSGWIVSGLTNTWDNGTWMTDYGKAHNITFVNDAKLPVFEDFEIIKLNKNELDSSSFHDFHPTLV